MKRRKFCQMMLWAAGLAAIPASAATRLQAHYDLERRGDLLVVALRVENKGTESIDVLVSGGFGPAVKVEGSWRTGVDQGALVALPDESVEQRPVTRAGPRRIWLPVAPGKSLDLGSFRFRAPARAIASLTAVVQTPDGAVQLVRDKLTLP